MTVALYLGQDAEEQWRREISKYSHLRHPNLMQVYATASSNGIWATVFHDEMIPLDNFLQTYGRHSPLWAMYVLFCSNTLLTNVFQAHMECYPGRQTDIWPSCTWVRSGSGRLCVDFTIVDCADGQLRGSDEHLMVANMLPDSAIWGKLRCFEPQESLVLSGLPLNNLVWDWGSKADDKVLLIPASSTVYWCAVVDESCPNEGSFLKIVESSPDRDLDLHWDLSTWRYTVTQTGWIRIAACDVHNIFIKRWSCDKEGWLDQANYIFKRLQITSEHEKYVFIHCVIFTLRFDKALDDVDTPDGYLFLCPASDFQVGPLELRWPQCPAYWSLQESGGERLNEEEARRLGFPVMSFTTELRGSSWPQNVYTAVAKLHQAKGFDPYTQDAARHFNDPLFMCRARVSELSRMVRISYLTSSGNTLLLGSSHQAVGRSDSSSSHGSIECAAQ
ncbi:hypothetical protein FB45DRAFT_835558 [Roridomyces roridus]|uniref:Uncharacterized protein n=1 Tax=Roridomyces roridus TaxID=1738132 RepID=A0AAD7BQ58_9AGAR|nr:hypothetical protein FB45DRAFT_835558 [Roridomyces roridus]